MKMRRNKSYCGSTKHTTDGKCTRCKKKALTVKGKDFVNGDTKLSIKFFNWIKLIK